MTEVASFDRVAYDGMSKDFSECLPLHKVSESMLFVFALLDNESEERLTVEHDGVE